MMDTTILRIVGIALAGMIMAMMVKKGTPEIGIVLSLFIAALIFSLGLDAFRSVLSFLDSVTELTGISEEIILPVWKTCLIAIVTKITAEICRDAKEGAIAAGVETAGAVLGLYVAIPLFSGLLGIMNALNN